MPRTKSFDEKEVLSKAMHLFWKKGYHATSIQDLVNHLGINRASLYDTYGGKKKLFERTFTHYRTIRIDALITSLNNYHDVKKGFKGLFEMSIKESNSDTECKGCFVVNTTIELIPNDKDFSFLISENKKRHEQIFYKYLQSGVKRGQISKDKNLQAIATLFFTFFNGLKVVTKVDFDINVYLKSVDALLSVLD